MKILIADDHAIVRRGIKEILLKEFSKAEIVEAIDSKEVLLKGKKAKCDLVLLDISMPGRNGLETLKQLRIDGYKSPILMLSMHPGEQYALRVLKAGASGYVNKDCASEELVLAVHKVLSGKKYISPSVSEKLAQSVCTIGTNPSHDLLSDRELQVLLLIAEGKTISMIADELSLSVNTISTYRVRILEKLQLTNNSELIRYAMVNMLV